MILETFAFLFESDSDDVKKGAAEAKKTVDNLEKSLKSTDVVSTKLGSSFGRLIKQASAAALAFLSVGAVIGGIRATAMYADRLGELSKALDVDTEKLDVWGSAVKIAGGTAEGFQATVASMAAALSDFATKGKSRAAPFFKELGIRMTDAKGRARSFFDILPELADAFQKLSKMESLGIGQKLGLDQGTIMLLQGGRRNIEDIIKRLKDLGVITKQDAAAAENFNEQMDYTVFAFRTLFASINTAILPAFTNVLKLIEKGITFFRNNKDVVIGGLIAIGAVISYFLIPALTRMAVRSVIAFFPFYLAATIIGALIVAFALLYDEIQAFNRGAESFIGDVVKKWPILKEVINGVTDAFKLLLRAGELTFDYFITVVTQLYNGIKSVVNIVGTFIDKISSGISKAREFLGNGKYDHTLIKKNYQTALSSISLTPNALSAGRYSTRSTNVQTGQIIINTQATDANGIAGAFSESLETQMRQAVNNFDDGILA